MSEEQRKPGPHPNKPHYPPLPGQAAARPAPERAYVFRARLERIIDGDSLDLFIDCGLHAYRLERVRLYGVDAPEVRGPERPRGEDATEYVGQWLVEAHGNADNLAWPLLVATYKSDAFGRYLALIWDDEGRCLNDDIIAAGYADVWERKRA